MARSHSTTISYQDEEQKSVSSSSTVVILSSSLKFIDYDHNAKNETSGVYIPPVLTSIIMDYLGGDINTQKSKTEKACLSADIKGLTLFGRNCYELVAQRAATLILRGEEKDADEAVLILKNNPALLDCKVEVTDPRGRSIKQKVFEIAFMAGDVDLNEGITDEKEKGLVERITIACRVSQARIDEAKQVLLSPEAIEENAERNQRIMAAVKKFGEGIINIPPNEEEKDEKKPYNDRMSAYRLRCKEVIDQYKADLQSAQSGSIHCGYIFDPSILVMTDQWFADNAARLEVLRSLRRDMFDVNVYGTLQGELSSRDAQTIKSGITNLTENGRVPKRSLKNPGGSAYFNSGSTLGVDFLIGYWGQQHFGATRVVGQPYALEARAVDIIIRSKNKSIAKLTQHRTQLLPSRCTIM